MTAIPGHPDPTTLLLICDGCGRAFDCADPPRRWRALWERASASGWRGLDRQVGPHSCARCGD
ncbi:hypothetical protein [Saccharothrix algeriensis]|uniref:Uncharacterized protein n=1 Tax=Saccharothrix algeriensis TaxID=173560 RepID=A0A8T8HXX4_9PSEU|nr:hypothetical protein [Saccharothrix algeriensis]MBM7815075.1 hypothetical protein [Saccharothrix algeriensis]QTR03328.1 hypothetical protein J7S33_31135 [Saccharothrix algeriensis]